MEMNAGCVYREKGLVGASGNGMLKTAGVRVGMRYEGQRWKAKVKVGNGGQREEREAVTGDIAFIFYKVFRSINEHEGFR